MAGGLDSIGQPLILVVFILCVLAVGVWAAQRRRAGLPHLKKNGAMIDIIASRSLGVQSALLVVEVDGQRFLLGSSRAGMTQLGSWSRRDQGEAS